MDCRIALTVKSSGLPTNPLTLSYNSIQSTAWNSIGWRKIFSNADNTNCPLTSCELRENTCSTANTHSEFTIESSAPWKVSLQHSITDGYP